MSTGPSNGSALMNRTAAGVCSSSGIRSSANRWFSTLTPSHTFGNGHTVSTRQQRADPVDVVGDADAVAARRNLHCARHQPGDVVAHPLGALREDLERVLRRERHHRTHAIDERVGHVRVKQVAHRVDEHLPRLLPAQRLIEPVLVRHYVGERALPINRFALRSGADDLLSSEHLGREALGVAVRAARAHLRAAGDRIPRRVSPLDR
jgi:hypothetical protein